MVPLYSFVVKFACVERQRLLSEYEELLDKYIAAVRATQSASPESDHWHCVQTVSDELQKIRSAIQLHEEQHGCTHQ